MINPMRRYEFLLLCADVPKFLEQLREVGMVDITISQTNENLEDEKATRLKNSIGKLITVAKQIGAHQHIKPHPTKISELEPKEAAKRWTTLSDDIDKIGNQIETKRRENETLNVWGEFNSDMLTKLKNDGLTLKFCQCAESKFKQEWHEKYPIEVIDTQTGKVHFVVVVEDENETFDLPVQELKQPNYSMGEVALQIEEMKKELELKREELSMIAGAKDEIKNLARALTEEMDMHVAMASGDNYAEDNLRIIEGWSLEQDVQRIVDFADTQDVIFMEEEPNAEQNPPIKLKNNFFNRVFEPIGNLYMLPGYKELDMTPFFAPFFMLFFGVCFGDAGYGLLMLLGLAVAWKKIPVNYRDFAWLGIFLGISTIIMGTLTGNFFGIELINVEALGNLRNYIIDTNNMFTVAIGLGAVQVMFGQILRIFNRSRRGGSFLYGLSSLGWCILFLASGLAFADVVSWYNFDAIAYLVTVGIAGILILFFNTPKKNPIVNLGAGIYSIYEQATGIVGDLISYVRLFAIGLAGAIIAQVFNALAVGLSGDIPVVSTIVMILILIVGHGLNIFISALGAFVHPVRLTFVEFYKNAEFIGGGRAFKPLKRHNNNNNNNDNDNEK